MKDQILIIDTSSKKYPQIIHKEENPNASGFFECVVALEKENNWNAIVFKMSSSGKYTVKLLGKE